MLKWTAQDSPAKKDGDDRNHAHLCQAKLEFEGVKPSQAEQPILVPSALASIRNEPPTKRQMIDGRLKGWRRWTDLECNAIAAE